MAIVNANQRFSEARKKSLPITKTPRKVSDALNIDRMYKKGIGKLEPGKAGCLYDRCYLFEEINYINKDDSGKTTFLNQLMGWLKSMNMDFKITVANEYQDMEEFLSRVQIHTEEEAYFGVAENLNNWIVEKLEDGNPNVTKLLYLTVSCRAETLSEANIILNALDTTICDWFRLFGSRIIRLGGEERLKCLHSLIRVGKKEEEGYVDFSGQGRHSWKNDILPKEIRQHPNFLEFDDLYVSVLFGWKYRRSIDADTVLHSFSSVEFPSFVTLDFAPVFADVIQDKLDAASMNNEKAITDEEEQKRKNNIISTGPSYPRQRKKDNIEDYLVQVAENDETGFFMNFLVVVTAGTEEKLAERVAQMQAIGRKEGIVMETADYQQLKAFNTALPFGGRQVDYMRFFLASSVVAFQPYYAQDIIEPGGYIYGMNRTTKRLVIGNRKLLMNPHGIIIGHSGSGKSFFIKLTDILQTLIATEDDILVLDPQNEFQSIIKKLGGIYYDLTPKSKIYLNGFEVSDEVFAADEDAKEKFIARQTDYAKSLLAAIMDNITVTQEHNTVISRCTRRMFETVFQGRKLKKQPTLIWLREEIRKELEQVTNAHDEAVIRPIYNSMEEYTEGSCDMLAHPSNIRMGNRLIGFGLKNVPENNWEAVMLTVMHYTSSRLEYNQEFQRATNFIVDETQVVSKKGTSADQLNTCVATFRKFGGICTMAMQNLTAALENKELKELYSNCSYKLFLDQGGVDANALSEIQELSQTEFNALSEDKRGFGVMVWGKKVVLLDAELSKQNPLYDFFSTDFHEKARQTKESTGKGSLEDVREKSPEGEVKEAGTGEPEDVPAKEPSRASAIDRTDEIILDMASLTSITVPDILAVLDISPETAEKELTYLCEAGRLTRTMEQGVCRYKAVA